MNKEQRKAEVEGFINGLQKELRSFLSIHGGDSGYTYSIKHTKGGFAFLEVINDIGTSITYMATRTTLWEFLDGELEGKYNGPSNIWIKHVLESWAIGMDLDTELE